MKLKAETMDDKAKRYVRNRAARIQSQSNNWISFQMLKDALGETTFRQQIREELRPALTAQIPKIFRDIWQVKPSGVLSLNLS